MSDKTSISLEKDNADKKSAGRTKRSSAEPFGVESGRWPYSWGGLETIFEEDDNEDIESDEYVDALNHASWLPGCRQVSGKDDHGERSHAREDIATFVHGLEETQKQAAAASYPDNTIKPKCDLLATMLWSLLKEAIEKSVLNTWLNLYAQGKEVRRIYHDQALSAPQKIQALSAAIRTAQFDAFLPSCRRKRRSFLTTPTH